MGWYKTNANDIFKMPKDICCGNCVNFSPLYYSIDGKFIFGECNRHKKTITTNTTRASFMKCCFRKKNGSC